LRVSRIEPVAKYRCKLCGFICERFEMVGHWRFKHDEFPTRLGTAVEIRAQFEEVLG